MGRSYGRGPSRRDVPQVEVEVHESSQDFTDATSAPLGPLTTSANVTVTDCGRTAGDRRGAALSGPVRSTSSEPSPLYAAGDATDSRPPDSPGQWEVCQDIMGGGSCGICSGSWHHHFGSSSSRSDLLISSVRRRNCPGNRPTARPSPNGRRGSRQSPGGNRSPKHSWFYQTATGTASPLSINPSPTRTPAAKVATPNAPNR